MRRTKEEAIRNKRNAVKDAEEGGVVADSLAVRRDLIDRMKRGEMTFEQMQAELKRIKRAAKSKGLTTRDAVYRSA